MRSKHRVMRAWAASALAVLSCGCEGDDEIVYAELPVLIRVVDAGAVDCVEGGLLIQTGPDSNLNGQLDDAEVAATQRVCNGTSGGNGPDGPAGPGGPGGPDGAIGPQGCAFMPGGDCANADLAYADLTDRNLVAIDLSGANLRGAILWNARLEGADLTGADLTGAFVYNAGLAGAHLRGADFTGANLSNANMISSDADGAVFDNAYLYRARISAMRARGTSFRSAMMANINMRATNFSGSDFTGAILADSQLLGTNLDGAIMRNVDFSFVSMNSERAPSIAGTDFSGSTFRSGNWEVVDLASAASLDGVIYDNVNFNPLFTPPPQMIEFRSLDPQVTDYSGISLYGANFFARDLRGLDFSGRFMSRSNLTNSTAEGARFVDTCFSCGLDGGRSGSVAQFSGARMRDANMQGAIIRNLDIRNLNFEGVNLDGADLSFAQNRFGGTNSTFAGASMVGSSWQFANISQPLDMTGVDLTGATVPRAVLTAADFTGATFSDTRYDSLTQFPVGIIPAMEPGLVAISTTFASSETGNFDNLVYQNNLSFEAGQDYTTYSFRNMFTQVRFSSGSDLSGVSFAGSEIPNSQFHDSVAVAATFDDAILRGSDMSNMNLAGASFDGADLSFVDFGSAATTITNADFTGANLFKADIEHLAPHQLATVTYNDTICPNGLNSDLAMNQRCDDHTTLGSGSP